MDVSTPPSLDLACPQAKAGIDNHHDMFRDRGVDKTKYEHKSIMHIIITTKNFIINFIKQLLSYNFSC